MRATTVGLATAVFAFLTPSGRPPVRTVAPAVAPQQRQDQPKILLAEVMFAPKPGETAFVELANVGGNAVDLMSMVLRIDTVVLPLPRLAEPVAAVVDGSPKGLRYESQA